MGRQESIESLAQCMPLEDFSYSINVNGCVLLHEMIAPASCEAIKKDVFDYYQRNRGLQIAAGIGETAQWGAHHICGRHDHIHEFLESDCLHEYLTAFFGGKPYILNSIGASINAPAAQGAYEHGHRWHRDLRSYAGGGDRQMAIALVMLDDFTADNGATEVLLGTHHAREFPPESFIRAHGKPVCGKQGSIILYDGDIIHRAGVNRTDKFRIGMTCLFTKPYYKQQMDYPRFLCKEYADSLSPRMRQLFGFNARVPSAMEEWYCPDGRFYKADQE